MPLEARPNNAKAQVESALNTLDNFEHETPLDGEVIEVNVPVNETVGPKIIPSPPSFAFALWGRWGPTIFGKTKTPVTKPGHLVGGIGLEPVILLVKAEIQNPAREHQDILAR
jgi:hypothetical protein